MDRYDHWNEEAALVERAENDQSSPDADMSDAEIKQAVYDRIAAGDDDWPEGE